MIKNLELFPKKKNFHTKQTLIGAFFTLMSVTLIMQLAFDSQIRNFSKFQKVYFQPHLYSSDENLNMNFHISFPHIPCFMVNIQQQNVDSSAKMLTDRIAKFRTHHELKVDEEKFPQFTFNREKFEYIMQHQEGCEISGEVKAPFAETSIQFHFDDIYIEFYEYIRRNKGSQDQYKLNADHTIKHLSFGSFMSHDVIIKKLKSELPNEKWDQMLSFSPVDNTVVEQNGQVSYLQSGNVINTKIDVDQVVFSDYTNQFYKDFIKREILPPFLQINFDFSPLEQKIIIDRHNIGDFFIEILGILGGVFSLFSYLNIIATNIFSSVEQSKLESDQYE